MWQDCISLSNFYAETWILHTSKASVSSEYENSDTLILSFFFRFFWWGIHFESRCMVESRRPASRQNGIDRRLPLVWKANSKVELFFCQNFRKLIYPRRLSLSSSTRSSGNFHTFPILCKQPTSNSTGRKEGIPFRNGNITTISPK